MAETSDAAYEFEVGPRFAGKRIDQYLAKKLPELSRSYIQKLLDEGAAELDGDPARRSQRIAAGQQITFVVPEPKAYDVLAEDIPLDVVYQDDDIVLVN